MQLADRLARQAKHVRQHRVGVLAESLTREALLSAYRNRRFFSTEDKDLALDVRASGFPMGSRLVGVPNAALGLTLYIVLAFGLILDWPFLLLLLLTCPAVAMSVVLGYSLISNRRQCRICWIGHAANATLFVMFASLAL